jgi:uncharacterized membrane protein
MENWRRHERGFGRLFGPDALRGLIITLMALDHANIFIAHKHSSGEYWGGSFPVYSDSLAFLTRFVTHFCAPGFFLLMGIGMVVFAHSRQERGWGKWEVMRHFLIRGGVLIALQLLVVNRAWELTPGGWGIQIYIGVLFALGVTMILGSLLLWFKPGYLLGISVVLLIGMEVLVPDPSLWGAGKNFPTAVFLLPGGIPGSGGNLLLWTNYPALQWFELVTFGMVFGKWFIEDRHKALNRAWQIGAIFLISFLIMRYFDGFGNIRPRMSDSWIDFLNPVKYPPSISFTLMTTGINLILLGLFSRANEKVRPILQPLVIFGQAPLFFYVLHLFLYAGLGYWLTPDGTGFPTMYIIWLLGLLVLNPLCLWYRQFKHRRALRSILQFL